MRHRFVIAIVATTVVTGGLVLAQDLPSWTSSPTSGPSPNTIQVSGTLCRVNPGGQLVPGEAVVELLQPNGSPFAPAVTQTYLAAEDGTWSGPFAIPAGLGAATYPLRALCRSPGGGPGLGFDYTPDRSYTVVRGASQGQAPTATPIETGELSFTG